ncbi:MAG: hypothetical protein HY897_10945 [Deltaproteobacteria bacterium]|nr:hypothetical protein [Deltaproteobacteria bacterium]
MARMFDMPLSNHRRIYGAFLAAHAVPDAINLMFTGVGCKSKAQRQIAMHDRVREAGNKMVWSDIGDAEFIRGPAKRLASMAIETCRRRENVGLVVVTTSAAMEMTGADVESELAAIRREVGCPVIYLPTAGWDGDLYAGYGEATSAVMALAPWGSSEGDSRTVCVSGYLFDRYEPDHAANLREIQRMLGAAGASRGAVFFSGSSMRTLMEAPAAGCHLVLPYARRVAAWAGRETGRRVVATDLPVGIAASARFIVASARLVGLSGETARSLAEAESLRARPALSGARAYLSGLRVGVLAETPMAAGLCSLLLELGMVPVFAGLLDRTLGGKRAFFDALASSAGALRGCLVAEDPSAQDVEDVCRRLRGKLGRRDRGRPFDLLIAPDLWLPPSCVDGVKRVELGFPSNRWHPVSPEPFIGFAGAVALAHRIAAAEASR